VHDSLQETQLIYGERVRVLNTQGEWAQIEAIEQPEFTHHQRWEGYPGWVARRALHPLDRARQPNAVIVAKWASVWSDPHGQNRVDAWPLGAHVTVTPTPHSFWAVQPPHGAPVWMAAQDVRIFEELRKLSVGARRRLIVQAATTFVGDPYFWGGRSPSGQTSSVPVSGVDCSGLVNLAYRAVGLDIPRDAHEQYLRAHPLAVPKLADLVFLSEAGHPKNIVHVMLYAGEDWMIEGPGTGSAVRRIRTEERFGRPLRDVRTGNVINGQTICFGTYFE